MTPDQTELVRRLHLQASEARRGSILVAADDIIRLINFLKMEERRGDVAEATFKRILTRAAEENLEELLQPKSAYAPQPPRTAEAPPAIPEGGLAGCVSLAPGAAAAP